MITFKGTNTVFTFLPSGDIYTIHHKNIMVNQLNGNLLDGSANQIYLRVFKHSKIKCTPLLGVHSPSRLSISQKKLEWNGTFEGITYSVSFSLSTEDIWFWEVTLQGEGTVDLLYGQDVGIASKDAIQSNEAYVSQYIDHFVHQENGFTICSRQNQPQPQGNKFPYLQQGSLQKTISFSTDGYQFFGKSYKETNIPEALSQDTLATEVYQYEMAYIGLQSEKINVNEKKSVIFYGVSIDHHPSAVEKPIFSIEQIQKIWNSIDKQVDDLEEVTKIHNQANSIVKTQSFTSSELDELFGKQVEKEVVNDTLLSFFTNKKHHVVLKEKELQMERAHGHILLSGTDLLVNHPLLATTVYMYGIFNSQIVFGNTSMNKLMSNSRNALNIMKKSGQRIYLKQNSEWKLLTMPTAFEMGFNVARWYYKLEDDLLMITNYTTIEDHEIKLRIESKQGKHYDFIISNHILMNDIEDSVPYELINNGNIITFNGSKNSTIGEKYPNLTYHVYIKQPFTIKDESAFISNQPETTFPLVLMEIKNQKEVDLTIQASMDKCSYKHHEKNETKETDAYSHFIDSLLNDFELKHPKENVEKMNLLSRWYTHNMLVHYLSPHGLEQYGGAAWGTRDVSQGPVEYFFAVNRPDIVREIIKKIYINQFDDDGNWPQWFMFDRFEKIKADESHGDVIVWPLKVVADYLRFTNDTSLLEEKIPYTTRKSFEKTKETYRLFEHMKKQIQYIENNFLPNTYLSCYGDGDWDDTLQPYDSKLKKNMASSWTVALTYQTLRNLATVMREFDSNYATYVSKLVTNIKNDYTKYMLSTDTIPGFVYMDNPEHTEWIIHPEDKKTSIQYRLLPMTRSIIAEITTPEEAAHHYQIIKDHLYFPDGVRLMNRPATYKGGVSTNFKRAEQSANFGREIGLQYVHAHIRFIEAMAKLGETNETWKGLNTINPIKIHDQVKNADIRQSNAYFSSSDGKFKTRYEAQEKFGKLKNGEVQVKGGWRIYSSGPGIYMNQLISNVLGIRQTAETIIIDPVLPIELDALQLTFKLLDKKVHISYHLGTQNRKISLNNTELNYTFEKNLYRKGGFIICKKSIIPLLLEDNYLEVFC